MYAKVHNMQCVPLTRASDAEFCCCFLCWPVQFVEQAVELSMIWDAIMLIYDVTEMDALAPAGAYKKGQNLRTSRMWKAPCFSEVYFWYLDKVCLCSTVWDLRFYQFRLSYHIDAWCNPHASTNWIVIYSVTGKPLYGIYIDLFAVVQLKWEQPSL